MSLFPIPAKVVKKLDKLRRNFLWKSNKEGKGYNFVNWKNVLLSKERGGLGIRNLRLQNESLLMKWLWRYTEEDAALWKEVIVAKYGELNSWCTKITSEPYGVGVWRTIRNLWPQMEGNVYIKVGNGNKTKFWKDGWIDQTSLRELFPDLFLICENPDARTIRIGGKLYQLASGGLLGQKETSGAYKLIPFYKGENTIFDVSPSSMSISVQHDHVIVPEKFQVTGFSVGGRVVDGDGNGIEGVEILVDGQKKSITDKEGYYKLDQVTSKRYTIEAKKVHYRFDRLIDFLVLPNMASISDIKAASYDVCGVAQTVNSEFKAKVALTHGPQNVKPQVKLTDESGHFCFEWFDLGTSMLEVSSSKPLASESKGFAFWVELVAPGLPGAGYLSYVVPPGDYRLSAIPANLENAKELLFSPSHIDVSVRSPILDVKFYQAQVSIHGSVVCKEKCGSSLSLTLLRLDGRNKDDKKTIGLANESNEFFFSNVLPGKYRVELKLHLPTLGIILPAACLSFISSFLPTRANTCPALSCHHQVPTALPCQANKLPCLVDANVCTYAPKGAIRLSLPLHIQTALPILKHLEHNAAL
ncbi:hypothetical protein MTR67_025165 [Solanum verrucosum]|uniref:Uncharacterized protein n=1 Tax=Solanum verrucosum TaxID=315347 RepID=A0AAF0TYQ2_SOLVR|nr:hypothetical protein MTR67_025165 [Solanum verrucosum]